MHGNTFVDETLVTERLSDIHNTAGRLRAARIARGPATLATAGIRTSVAGWVSRAVFRAEPCAGERRLAR